MSVNNEQTDTCIASVYGLFSGGKYRHMPIFNDRCLVMRNPVFCIYENKGADLLLGNHCTFVFASYPSIRNFKSLAIFCGCPAGFVSDLVGNHEGRFSHDTAQIQVT